MNSCYFFFYLYCSYLISLCLSYYFKLSSLFYDYSLILRCYSSSFLFYYLSLFYYCSLLYLYYFSCLYLDYLWALSTFSSNYLNLYSSILFWFSAIYSLIFLALSMSSSCSPCLANLYSSFFLNYYYFNLTSSFYCLYLISSYFFNFSSSILFKLLAFISSNLSSASFILKTYSLLIWE